MARAAAAVADRLNRPVHLTGFARVCGAGDSASCFGSWGFGPRPLDEESPREHRAGRTGNGPESLRTGRQRKTSETAAQPARSGREARWRRCARVWQGNALKGLHREFHHNPMNPMVDGGMQQAHQALSEQAAEAGRTCEGGTCSRCGSRMSKRFVAGVALRVCVDGGAVFKIPREVPGDFGRNAERCVVGGAAAGETQTGRASSRV